MLSYAMVMHPMGTNSLAATPAVVKVARPRLPMPPQNLGVRRFCTPTKHEAVDVASRARLASLAPRCLVGSKKEFSFLLDVQPWSSPTQQIPLPRRWNWTTCGRVYSKKHTTSGCGWPCAARGGRWSLTRWVIGVKKPVGACGRPFHQPIAGALFHRLLGDLCSRDPGGTAYSRRKRNG